MTILTAPTDPSARVVDALGREWAKSTRGDWCCLGYALAVDTFDELDARYIVCEVTA